ncbi:hypothetical protein HKD37_05G013112 [Glycine soja]
MKTQLKSMKIKVEKTKTLKKDLANSKEFVAKLQTDFDKHVASLSAKSKENNTLNILIVALDKSVTDVKAKFADFSSQFAAEQTKSKTAEEEKKIAKDKLTSANEEVANLKKIVAR